MLGAGRLTRICTIAFVAIMASGAGSPAAVGASTTLQAESLTPDRHARVKAGKAKGKNVKGKQHGKARQRGRQRRSVLLLGKRGRATGQVTFAGSVTRAVVVARAKGCGRRSRLALRLDGEPVLTTRFTKGRDYRRRGRAVAAAPGVHSVELAVVSAARRCRRGIAVDRLLFRETPAAPAPPVAVAPPPRPPPPPPPPATWRFPFPKLGNAFDAAVFRNSPDGTMNFGGPLPSEGADYPLGDIQVITGGVGGAPPSIHPSGRVARVEVKPGGLQHAKLYKYVEFAQGASGTYEATFWLPRDFAIAGPYTAVNVLQFKNGAGMNSGNSIYRLSVSLMPASFARVRHPSGRADAPVAVIRHDNDWGVASREGGNDASHGPQTPVVVPLGVPVRMRAEVAVGDRIQFFVNEQPLGVVHNSHVAFSGVPGYTRSLIFGIGHYSPDPGYLYILDAAFTRR